MVLCCDLCGRKKDENDSSGDWSQLKLGTSEGSNYQDICGYCTEVLSSALDTIKGKINDMPMGDVMKQTGEEINNNA